MGWSTERRRIARRMSVSFYAKNFKIRNMVYIKRCI
ncbi:hypothetical protein M0802_016913, partial [Mischocyttarus mexicanus]